MDTVEWSNSKQRPYWVVNGKSVWNQDKFGSDAIAKTFNASASVKEPAENGAVLIMRRKCNDIKRIIFDRFVGAGAHLEVGVGRGGDLGKIRNAARSNGVACSRIIGVDIASGALEEARRRDALVHKSGATLGLLNMCEDWTETTKNLLRSYNLRTAGLMFCMHYAETNPDTFAENLGAVMGEGSILFGVVPDPFVVKKYLEDGITSPFSSNKDLVIKETFPGFYKFGLGNIIVDLVEPILNLSRLELSLERRGFFLREFILCKDPENIGLGLYSVFFFTRVHKIPPVIAHKEKKRQKPINNAKKPF